MSHLIFLLRHNWCGPRLPLAASCCINPHMGWVSEKTDAFGSSHEKGRRICSSVNWVETYGVLCVGVTQWLTHTHSHSHTNCGPCYLAQTVTPWLWVWSPGSWNPLQCEWQTDSTVQPLILSDQPSYTVFITLHNGFIHFIVVLVAWGGGRGYVSGLWISKNSNKKN